LLFLHITIGELNTVATAFLPRPVAYDSSMHEGGYHTYIMASRSHTLYIGVTGNLLKRVFQHKWREHEGFTERYNCDRLVWFERHKEVGRAITRERI
jgi:predicted GIY-YIG superfamily endonuclease